MPSPILFFIAMTLVEIAVLIKVGNHVGMLNAILIIIGTGVIGTVMMRIQGFVILQKISERLNRGAMPNAEVLDGLLMFVGGVCLIAPGIIGDVIGFILLIPWARLLLRKLLAFVIKSRFDRGQTITIVPISRYNDPEI
ncbi:MAG: FxsA family protein [Candidatus Omnitrophica bacterium]|nr:FxsA family protein [Candidatus Omnitrophota bacterium]